MPRYSGSAANQAPLIIQVSSPTTGQGSISSCFAVKVDGQTTTGNVSRPVLWRPSTLGTGTPQTTEERGRTSFTTPPGCTLITSFSTSPSLPVVNVGPFNLPIRVSWMVDPLEGVIFQNGGAVALYQSTSGGSTTSGSISWEEQ